MKYLPLVWAALLRDKLRAILILLAATAAYALFGLSIGFDASVRHLADLAPGDRIGVRPRFGEPMPLAMADQIARLPGVKAVSPWGAIFGYYQVPRNNTGVLMVGDNIKTVMPELPIGQAQLDELKTHPDGIFFSRMMAQRWHPRLGSHFPIKGTEQLRTDGSDVWTFQVLGIVEDNPDLFPSGFAIGSFNYFDRARIQTDQGKTRLFRVISANPALGDATARLIDQSMGNSGNPTASITDKFDATNELAVEGINVDFLARAIAGAGLFMILFLIGNAIAKSALDRISEFALLKIIGFSDKGVTALVFAEAVLLCLPGAGLGLLIAHWIVTTIPHFFPVWNLPLPAFSPLVYALAFGSAALVAALSAILPALFLKRLNVAAALSGRA